MQRHSLLASGALALALTLGAGAAQAAPIIGSISFADGFGSVPTPPPPTSSIVSGQTAFDINNVFNVYSPGSANGSFAGTSSATGFDFNTAALPTTFFTTNTGFTFTLTAASVASNNPLACAVSGLCTDSIAFDVRGTVTGPAGTDPTEFLGSWTANGSCLGGGAQCESNVTASWSASLTATGRPSVVPEPGGLALAGLALAGLAFVRRRV
jgi:hypothetical protein